MDLQLQVTDKELEEFPEEKSDQINISKGDKSQPSQKAHTASTASCRRTAKNHKYRQPVM